MPKDFRGQELEVGDIVVYVSSGRYTDRIIGQVIDLKKKVKLQRVNRKTLQPIEDTNELYYAWVEPENCFAVSKFKGE